jgi:putative oxidoreductase
MKVIKTLFWIRISLAVIFIMHSVPGMFNGGVNDFGTRYLDVIGFSPFGLYVAWLIKLSHLVLAFLLILNRWLIVPIILTIFILIAGIIFVHYESGWYVVGGGANGIEFNFLLIFALFQVLLVAIKELNNKSEPLKE